MTLRVPSLSGRIERRLLINFRADPQVVRSLVPEPLELQLVGGKSIVGICVIRLASARPTALPRSLGITAEHVAHRIAVTLPERATDRAGVFVPRRHTNSAIVALVGSRFLSGGLHRARARVVEGGGRYRVELTSADHLADVFIDGTVTDSLPATSVFADLEASSHFFAAGSVGYSPGARHGSLDGVRLVMERWSVRPLNVTAVHSSFFENRSQFPAGSIAFDHALVMTDIETRWTALPPLTMAETRASAAV